MSASVNKVILVGNLGADPELKSLPSGQSVCEMRIATNESYTDKQGDKHDKVEWHRIVSWGKQGENCAKYLKKGRQVYIEGRLQTRSWEDAQGVKKYSTEIVAMQVQFLGGGEGKGHDQTAPGPSGGTSRDSSYPPPQDDNIPF